MDIITYEQAKENNLREYFTGVPCRHGHLSPRRVSNKSCIECANIKCKAWRENNKEYDSNYHKQRYQETKNHRKKMSRQWKEQNKEYYSAQQKRYYANNKNNIAEYHKEWYKNNKQTILSRMELHRNNTRKLNYENFKQMALNYTTASVVNEDSYKWFCAAQITNCFGVEVLCEHALTTESRIDIYIPDFKIGIECKLDGTRWSTTKIEEQMSRYRQTAKCDEVILTSPFGEYGLSFIELIVFLQDRIG